MDMITELPLVVEIADGIRRLGSSHVLLFDFLLHDETANNRGGAHPVILRLHRHYGSHVLAAYVDHRIFLRLFLHQENILGYQN